MLEMLTTELAPIFTVPAVFGTAFFLLRLVLLLVGAADAHLEVHTDGVDFGDAHHTDPGEAFKYLSLQSVLGFAMGFGWAGLAAYRAAELSVGLSMLVAVAGGVAIVWLLALLMKAMHDLQSSGNVDPHNTIGHEGDVYLSIPSTGSAEAGAAVSFSPGRGQVRVTIDDRQRIYDAIEETLDGRPPAGLPTGTRVRVVGVDGGHTLRVVRA